MHSINPFASRMSEELKQDFIEDYIKIAGSITENEHLLAGYLSNSPIKSRYKLVICVLTK